MCPSYTQFQTGLVYVPVPCSLFFFFFFLTCVIPVCGSGSRVTGLALSLLPQRLDERS